MNSMVLLMQVARDTVAVQSDGFFQRVKDFIDTPAPCMTRPSP